MQPMWITAFLDLAAEDYAAGVAFWRDVTGYEVSPSRGENGEFATLQPAGGDAHLRVQRLDSGPSGVHIDVHWPEQSFEVRSSPGRLTYCAVSEPLSAPAAPATWPGGHRSIVDQVCLDIPPADYEGECTFWSELTGWELRDKSVRFPEFRALDRPAGQPVRILLQRVGDHRPQVTAHLDLASDDRPAEVRRHEELGAVVLREHEVFTVLRDPAGLEYCVTDRDPGTGLLN